MNQSNLSQMADIFLPLPPEPVMPVWLLFVAITAALFILSILSLLLWKYIKEPLSILERQLKQGRLSSRETAHCLAHIVLTKGRTRSKKENKKNSDLPQQIDQLRFQRQTPDINELLILINTENHDR